MNVIYVLYSLKEGHLEDSVIMETKAQFLTLVCSKLKTCKRNKNPSKESYCLTYVHMHREATEMEKSSTSSAT